MFWKSVRRHVHTLRFRLTLWYGVVFTVMLMAAFVVAYRALVQRMETTLDEKLATVVRQFDTIYRNSGFKGLSRVFSNECARLGTARVFCRMVDASGFTLFSSDMSSWKAVPTPSPKEFWGLDPDTVIMDTLNLPTKPYPVRVALLQDVHGNIFEYGISLEQIVEASGNLRELFLLTTISMVVVAVTAGHMVATRAMMDLQRITDVVHEVMAGDFSRRVPELRAGEEVETLARAFNMTTERVETLIHDLKDVTSNVAHDLRSPLTRIRAAAEMALMNRSPDEDPRETLGLVLEECDRLIGMINTMLEIAEADSGVIDYRSGVVDLARVAAGAAELFQPVAEARNIELTVHVEAEHAPVLGDLSMLQRVVSNLLDNAIKFTPEKGHVRVRISRNRKTAVFEVEDTGPGIPPEDTARIFERFYRGDASRTTPGNGLGLSYVQSVVRAHGGEIRIDSTVGAGTTMRVHLPLHEEEDV